MGMLRGPGHRILTVRASKQSHRERECPFPNGVAHNMSNGRDHVAVALDIEYTNPVRILSQMCISVYRSLCLLRNQHTYSHLCFSRVVVITSVQLIVP